MATGPYADGCGSECSGCREFPHARYALLCRTCRFCLPGRPHSAAVYALIRRAAPRYLFAGSLRRIGARRACSRHQTAVCRPGACHDECDVLHLLSALYAQRFAGVGAMCQVGNVGGGGQIHARCAGSASVGRRSAPPAGRGNSPLGRDACRSWMPCACVRARRSSCRCVGPKRW